ncbi:MAG TPA: hypothetical protein VG985_04055 [Xanthobacteraceae bacterium]|nr:hypothetical protein [Xanthobacteraceae bacterium]
MISRPTINVAKAHPALRRERLPAVVLDDHARLPWRFFGRLRAALHTDC